MAQRGRLVAVEGGSASGKTSLVRAAAHTFGWRPLPEAFDRLDPAPSLGFASGRELLQLEVTLLAEETRRFQEAQRLCAAGATVLADTGFLGPVTYTLGLAELGLAPATVAAELLTRARFWVGTGRLGLPDLTVYLRTTARERTARSRAGARSHPPELFRRHEAVGRLERRVFEREMPEVCPVGVRLLRADRPTAALVRRLGAVVGATPLRSASRAETLALLARLARPVRGIRRSAVGPNR